MPIISGGVIIEQSRLRGFTPFFVAANNAPSELKTIAHYVCDGVADEVQINLALSEGSVVVLSPGTFNLADSIVIPANRKLFGSGISITTITIPNATNVHLVTANNATGVAVIDLTINGNGTNQTSNGRCVNFVSVTDGLIENVHAINSRDNAVNLSTCVRPRVNNVLSESALGLNTGIQFFQCTEPRCTKSRALGHNSGIKFDQSNNGNISECYVDVLGLGHGAINLKQGSSGNRIYGNFCTGMSNGHSGIEIYGSHNVVYGNTIEGKVLNAATGCGIEISASNGYNAQYNLVSENQIRNVREIGIWLRRESGASEIVTHNRIQDNVLFDGQSSNRATHGIREDVPADNNDVHYNTVLGFATAQVLTTGAGTSATSNRIA